MVRLISLLLKKFGNSLLMKELEETKKELLELKSKPKCICTEADKIIIDAFQRSEAIGIPVKICTLEQRNFLDEIKEKGEYLDFAKCIKIQLQEEDGEPTTFIFQRDFQTNLKNLLKKWPK